MPRYKTAIIACGTIARVHARAWLGVPDQPAHAAGELETDLRQLSGLAGSGFAADDHDLMVADRRRDVVSPLRHRQLRRIDDAGNCRGARRRPRARGGDRRRDAFDLRRGDAAPFEAVDAGRQSRAVGGHAFGELGAQAVGDRNRWHRHEVQARHSRSLSGLLSRMREQARRAP